MMIPGLSPKPDAPGTIRADGGDDWMYFFGPNGVSRRTSGEWK